MKKSDLKTDMVVRDRSNTFYVVSTNIKVPTFGYQDVAFHRLEGYCILVNSCMFNNDLNHVYYKNFDIMEVYEQNGCFDDHILNPEKLHSIWNRKEEKDYIITMSNPYYFGIDLVKDEIKEEYQVVKAGLNSIALFSLDNNKFSVTIYNTEEELCSFESIGCSYLMDEEKIDLLYKSLVAVLEYYNGEFNEAYDWFVMDCIDWCLNTKNYKSDVMLLERYTRNRLNMPLMLTDKEIW